MPVRNTQNDRVARIFSASFATTLVGVTLDEGVCFDAIPNIIDIILRSVRFVVL